MSVEQLKHTCCICKGEYEGYGHSTRGVEKAAGGRCCDDCNTMVVVPVRMRVLTSGVLAYMWELPSDEQK